MSMKRFAMVAVLVLLVFASQSQACFLFGWFGCNKSQPVCMPCKPYSAQPTQVQFYPVQSFPVYQSAPCVNGRCPVPVTSAPVTIPPTKIEPKIEPAPKK